MWLATALLVLHPHYRAVGTQWLDRLGLPAGLMWATCAGELALGLRVLLGPMAPWLAGLQLALMLGFTAILAGLEPLLLAHPFGVLSKNLPLCALVLSLALVEREGWSPRALGVLRAGMAAIWISEGLFPKLLFQQPLELEVVARSGLVPGDPATFLACMGAAQVASGVLVLVLPVNPRAWLLLGQALALVLLPLLVSLQDPLLWVHPFGPLTKNVPILAGTLLLLRRDAGARFLTARWSHVALVTWTVPPRLLEPHLPPGVEPDLHQGQGVVSLASLDFSRTRVLGVPWPGHGRFPDVNLRLYARRGEERGVVFVRELVPLRAVALFARLLAGEPFQAVPLESRVEEQGERLTVTRRFQAGGAWQQVQLQAARRPAPADELARFAVERHVGWGRGRFRVTRPPWELLEVEACRVEVDFAAVYGPEWACLRDAPPTSVVLAEGSPVVVSLD